MEEEPYDDNGRNQSYDTQAFKYLQLPEAVRGHRAFCLTVFRRRL
jgi:hypothetical protein